MDLIAGRERASNELIQYNSLLTGVGEVFSRRDRGQPHSMGFEGGLSSPQLSAGDREIFLEVFWSLFRDGVITLGFNDSNREFPFFRVTEFGRKLIAHSQAYFFHDVSSFENAVKTEIPAIDPVTLLYLKEAMQSFRTGCLLASSVMLGVATEHTFLLLSGQSSRSAITAGRAPKRYSVGSGAPST
jgi:hypothetical protein